MSDNKNKVIGVRFDDNTLKRLKILAESSHDTVSGIIRRATMYCLPAFEGGPFPVSQPASEAPGEEAPGEEAPGEEAPVPVPVASQTDPRKIDIMDVIISEGSNGDDTGD